MRPLAELGRRPELLLALVIFAGFLLGSGGLALVPGFGPRPAPAPAPAPAATPAPPYGG